MFCCSCLLGNFDQKMSLNKGELKKKKNLGNNFHILFQIGNLGNLGKVVSVVQTQPVQSGVVTGQAGSNTVAQILQVGAGY